MAYCLTARSNGESRQISAVLAIQVGSHSKPQKNMKASSLVWILSTKTIAMARIVDQSRDATVSPIRLGVQRTIARQITIQPQTTRMLVATIEANSVFLSLLNTLLSIATNRLTTTPGVEHKRAQESITRVRGGFIVVASRYVDGQGAGSPHLLK